MDQVVGYLLQHLELVITLVVDVITLVIVLIRKTKAGVSPLMVVLEELPGLIAMAEETKQAGKDKKLLVMSSAIARLSDLTGLTIDKCFDRFGTKVSESIEDILSTPRKK